MLHIVIGVKDDFDKAVVAAGTGHQVDWMVPKSAEPGDQVAFYSRDLNAFVGHGHLRSEIEPIQVGRQRTFAAAIGNIVVLAKPVECSRLIDLFPDWSWLAHRGSRTTPPPEVQTKLLDVLNDLAAAPQTETPGDEIGSEHRMPRSSLPTSQCMPAKLIHPIIMYPYTHPSDVSDLRALYTKLIASLDANKDAYARPLTVMNRQTYYMNARFIFDQKLNDDFTEFRSDVVGRYSDIIDSWCVDTCQMWLSGFGKAFDNSSTGEDVYWLIPGDFDYSSEAGETVLTTMGAIPDAVMEHEQDLCLGEIDVPINSPKQLIDTYGTYGLLYNWFPQEAQAIRKLTDKPRSEFFALRHSFLREILRQRWFGYEQTIVILLQAIVAEKRINVAPLGEIRDRPQGRDSLASAMQQVERTERVLKLVWRERHKEQVDWPKRFRKLDAQSEQIRGAALVILENLLR